MKIDANKKYKTRSGKNVEIFKVLGEEYQGSWKVLGAIFQDDIYWPFQWLKTGKALNLDAPSENDLIEDTPWSDLKIDDKVICWNNAEADRKRKRYFAGISASTGRPTTFINGATSWSNGNIKPLPWDHCEKIIEEDSSDAFST